MLSPLCVPFLMGLLVALGAGWFLLPVLRKLKAGQVVSTDAPKSHLAKGGTPTMGGIIILAGAVVAVALYAAQYGGSPRLMAVVASTLAFGAIGFIDDLLIVRRGKNLGLRAREKLAGQFVVALAFTGWYYQVDGPVSYFGVQAIPLQRLLLAAFQVLLLVGLSNAVNLTDGLDGLAAGVSLPAWITLGLLGVFAPAVESRITTAGDYGTVAFCAAFAGATLGYLWYNAHPAQVFMGDTGSLAIGGGMAAAGIALHLEWMLLLVALVHWIEAASVILQVISFKTTGRRIFKMSPLHHHFELCEWPETRVVARFAIASAICGAAALVVAFRG